MRGRPLTCAVAYDVPNNTAADGILATDRFAVGCHANCTQRSSCTRFDPGSRHPRYGAVPRLARTLSKRLLHPCARRRCVAVPADAREQLRDDLHREFEGASSPSGDRGAEAGSGRRGRPDPRRCSATGPGRSRASTDGCSRGSGGYRSRVRRSRPSRFRPHPGTGWSALAAACSRRRSPRARAAR